MDKLALIAYWTLAIIIAVASCVIIVYLALKLFVWNGVDKDMKDFEEEYRNLKP